MTAFTGRIDVTHLGQGSDRCILYVGERRVELTADQAARLARLASASADYARPLDRPCFFCGVEAATHADEALHDFMESP